MFFNIPKYLIIENQANKPIFYMNILCYFNIVLWLLLIILFIIFIECSMKKNVKQSEKNNSIFSQIFDLISTFNTQNFNFPIENFNYNYLIYFSLLFLVILIIINNFLLSNILTNVENIIQNIIINNYKINYETYKYFAKRITKSLFLNSYTNIMIVCMIILFSSYFFTKYFLKTEKFDNIFILFIIFLVFHKNDLFFCNKQLSRNLECCKYYFNNIKKLNNSDTNNEFEQIIWNNFNTKFNGFRIIDEENLILNKNEKIIIHCNIFKSLILRHLYNHENIMLDNKNLCSNKNLFYIDNNFPTAYNISIGNFLSFWSQIPQNQIQIQYPLLELDNKIYYLNNKEKKELLKILIEIVMKKNPNSILITDYSLISINILNLQSTIILCSSYSNKTKDYNNISQFFVQHKKINKINNK